jgi:hypothetical protein
MAIDLRLEAFHVVELRDFTGDEVVVEVVGILGPGIELPVGDGGFALRILDEDGAGVAEPDAVRAPVVEVQAGEVGMLAEEHVGCTLFGGEIVDEDVDVFDLREVADDFRVDPGDGLEFVGPVLGVVGPGDPGGGVRGPLGGHAVVLAVRCRHHCLSVGPPPPIFRKIRKTLELARLSLVQLRGRMHGVVFPFPLSVADWVELICTRMCWIGAGFSGLGLDKPGNRFGRFCGIRSERPDACVLVVLRYRAHTHTGCL